MFGRNRKLTTAALAIPLGIAALGLGGCATTATSDATAKSDGPTRSEVYVYQVDRAAENAGVRVIWVNPPKNEAPSGLSYSLQATVGDENERDG